MTKLEKTPKKFLSTLDSAEIKKIFIDSNKKNNLKEIIINKNNMNYTLETSMNSSSSLKKEEIKENLDLKDSYKKEKSISGRIRKESFEDSDYYKNNGDTDENINLEKILSEKNEFDEEILSFEENRINKKIMIKEEDKEMKSRFPLGKTINNNMNYEKKFYIDSKEGIKLSCGCIGDQVKDLCSIF